MLIFLQVFILTFEDHPDVVARLNGSYNKQDLTQPADLLEHRLQSEVRSKLVPPVRLLDAYMFANQQVDTMAYVHSRTSIPVPKVYAIVTDPQNPVGTRYTLQERVGILNFVLLCIVINARADCGAMSSTDLVHPDGIPN